jgi:hypothetical protein
MLLVNGFRESDPNYQTTPFNRDAESSERSAPRALRSEDSASRLNGHSSVGELSFLSFLPASR